MLTVFFTDAPVRDWPSAARCSRGAFAVWHAALLANGIYWPPSQFEAAFVSAAHDEETLSATLAAAQIAFAAARAHSDAE
jgi:glutamate-1-semialdehyde 2,1-aminomutase